MAANNDDVFSTLIRKLGRLAELDAADVQAIRELPFQIKSHDANDFLVSEGDQIVISGRHGEAGEELAHFVLRTTRIADGTCRFGGRPYEAGYIPGSGMTSMISIHAPGICR